MKLRILYVIFGYDFGGISKNRLKRPDNIKELINQMPPTQMYKFKNSKKQCYIIGYTEDGTLIVQKTGKGGILETMGWKILDTNEVFGVSPEDLEIWTD